MKSDKTLAAFTPAGVAPPYLNATLDAHTDCIAITVRSQANLDGSTGPVGCISLTRDEFANWVLQSGVRLCETE